MSQITRCTKAQSIESPGPLAMHVKHCDTCTDAPANESGNAIRADDVEVGELAHVTANMRPCDHKATRELHDFTPKESDSDRTATAKAIIDAKGGGGPLYREVFGTCPSDECNYGQNGFEATHCIRHESDASDASDEPEGSDESDGEPSGERETDRATYVKELLDVGVSPVKAEEAATARFD